MRGVVLDALPGLIETRVQTDVEALPDRLLRARQCGRRMFGDLRSELACARQQLRLRHDFAD
ncbi:MAG: hypothetical protein NTZ61_07180, partial [Proteobacteria bacterium]|nr:hypothetical protein [Pseudomonadota bacterium]